jgi:hypothetical protein
MFQMLDQQADGVHLWSVVGCGCNLDDETDALVLGIIDDVRAAYGEERILNAAALEVDEDQASLFNPEPLRTAFRLGLPDPSEEGNKPLALTNYRSEAAEIVARRALKAAYSIDFPAAPQVTKPNPNQPVLGFDGWGIMVESTDAYALVLVQVKGTDEAKWPPKVTDELVKECKAVPKKPDRISRALATLITLVDTPSVKRALFRMLENLGNSLLPRLIVAPVVVRGKTTSKAEDLQPLRAASPEFSPAIARGVTLSRCRFD